jgi:hypothetical protein
VSDEPPVVRHRRYVVNGWGESLCGETGGVLTDTGVDCPRCIDLNQPLVTSEHAA